MPGDARHVFVAAGPGYLADSGVLYESRDGGVTWRVGTLPPVKSTLFRVSASISDPDVIVAATKDGEALYSTDRGTTWTDARLPAGADPIYALAVS